MVWQSVVGQSVKRASFSPAVDDVSAFDSFVPRSGKLHAKNQAIQKIISKTMATKKEESYGTSTGTVPSKDIIKNQVLDALRSQKVKLWNGPYYKNDQINHSALKDLAKELKPQIIILNNGNGNDEGDDANLLCEMIYQALQSLQFHALEKLKKKKKKNSISSRSPTSVATGARWHDSHNIDLEIKVLGWKGDPLRKLKDDDGDTSIGGFSDSVEIDNSKKIVVLRLKGVSTHRTDHELLEFLKHIFPSSVNYIINLRLIHRGKNITTNNMSLGNLLQCSNTNKNNTIELLCLASTDAQHQQQEQPGIVHAGTNQNNIQTRIAAIRQATKQIRDTTQLEITDQHGQIVPMTGEDRLGFFAALAFHRLGRSTPSQQEALVFLLEADAEWKNHPNLQKYTDRVDNYGLLQLDIAWIYLQLESLHNLPDSLKRLEEAERVLKKQVHKNFITLALAQAEMGNAHEVPPLAAVFAKLFLLQGIAYVCDCNANINPSSSVQKSQERLDQAYCLLQSLRSMAPEESVQQLLEVMGSNTAPAAASLVDVDDGGQQQLYQQFTASDAIAALRRSKGHLDAAASALSEEATKRRKKQRDREVQHEFGLCENETDPVDLTQLGALKSLLKGQQDSVSSSSNYSDWLIDAAHTDLAAGLLRLTNNDLTRALDLYAENSYDATQVLRLAADLDEKLVRRGLMGRALIKKHRKKRKLHEQTQVDEIALATLVSMGVDDSKAKAALTENGNDVEKAMMWLSAAEEDNEGFEEEGEEKEKIAERRSDDDGKQDGPDGSEGEGGTPTEEKSTGGSHGDGDSPGMSAGTGAHDVMKGGGNDSQMQDTAEKEDEMDPQELLHRELGDVLEDRDLEKEYLGSDLNKEWEYVLSYRKSN